MKNQAGDLNNKIKFNIINFILFIIKNSSFFSNV